MGNPTESQIHPFERMEDISGRASFEAQWMGGVPDVMGFPEGRNSASANPTSVMAVMISIRLPRQSTKT